MASKESLSITEVARVFGCHRSTIYRLIQAGRLPAFELGEGGDTRVAVIDILAYRQLHRKKVKPKRPRAVEAT